jgi:hypothetical protein
MIKTVAPVAARVRRGAAVLPAVLKSDGVEYARPAKPGFHWQTGTRGITLRFLCVLELSPPGRVLRTTDNRYLLSGMGH